MPKPNRIIAILCSDIHLSLNPPVWRSAEDDWFEAMKRPLMEINKISETNQCPVICAGDVFDKWNSSPELINFAMRYLPKMYSIPGQHDLPLHNYEDIKKSAYWTLAMSGKLFDLNCMWEGINISVKTDPKQLILYPYPFGSEIKPCPKKKDKNTIRICVAHEYTWCKDYKYTDAPDKDNVKSKFKVLGTYDVVVIGDNHLGFKTTAKKKNQKTKTLIFNCGTLMRRKSDEKRYKPQVGLLMDDGSVKTHYLDTSKDKYIEEFDLGTDTTEINTDGLFEELHKLKKDSLDFKQAVLHYINEHPVDKKVTGKILESLEE